jgi:AraC-like DNA-binding protein
MDGTAEHPMDGIVEQGIKCIWERYAEPLSLTDIAGSAFLSKYHFCRVFSSETGISPGRFLSAVRIYQAKRLLLSTSANVAGVSFAVGFNSLGSFTNHFTKSVGVSPGRFRRMARDQEFQAPRRQRDSLAPAGRVAGSISLPHGYASASVYVGAFGTALIEGRHVSAAITTVTAPSRHAAYTLAGIPAGSWFAHAVAVADSADPGPWTRRVSLTSGSCELRMADGASASLAIKLRPRRSTDPPVLLALPDLEALLPGPGSESAAGRESLIAHG